MWGQRTNELGIRLNSFDNFGFIYKHGQSPDKLVRYRLAFANLRFQNLQNRSAITASCAFAIGWESRSDITEKLQFVRGPEPSVSVGYSTSQDINNLALSVAFGYVLGFQYNFSESFYLAIETIPSISSDFSSSNVQFDLSRVSLGFDSNAIALSAVHRFVR